MITKINNTYITITLIRKTIDNYNSICGVATCTSTEYRIRLSLDANDQISACFYIIACKLDIAHMDVDDQRGIIIHERFICSGSNIAYEALFLLFFHLFYLVRSSYNLGS